MKLHQYIKIHENTIILHKPLHIFPRVVGKTVVRIACLKIFKCRFTWKRIDTRIFTYQKGEINFLNIF